MATSRGVIGIVVMMMTILCITSSRAGIIRRRSEAETTPSVGQTDFDDNMMISEMMTSGEEAEVDGMFPAQMRDDLKLELILKALVILKNYEGHSSSVSSWFPSYDVMPLEIKLKLILKAIVLLKDRPSDSMFAGHRVIQLKLTLILKAISILKGDETNLGLTTDTGSLKLALLLKAIDILEVYKGEYKDTVFFTESNKQLKLELILKAITLLKHGNWPVDIDFWSMEEEGSQSEATTPEQMTREATTAVLTREETIVAEGATGEETTFAEGATGEETTGEMEGEMITHEPWLKHGLSKIFKWLKWVPKVLIHKKKHLIFH